MRITISGPPGSGKTTVCNILSKRLHMEAIISGQIFRQMAKERNLSLADFGKLCEIDPESDRLLDERMVQIARERDDVILEGRLTAHMLQRNGIPALKVLLDADPDIRAGRVAQRESKPVQQARMEVETREDCEERRYHRYYDIDLTDRSVYDLVIDTTDLTPEQVADRIIAAVEAAHDRDAC